MARILTWAALLCAVLAGPVAAQPVGTAEANRVEAIRQALLRLPYYGVFDFLTFSYEKGTVVLGGYAYRAILPDEAVRAARRVPGVDTVKVDMRTLPVSMFDDDIRWRVFYAIDTNAFLERYAPGAVWGLRHQFGPLGRFPGMQPLGTYPIHIIVEGGKVRLLGVVDNETDKTAATMAARGVAGTFGVENELVVQPPK